MHRFYAPPKNISREKIIIDDKQQLHHLKDVLRVKVEDEVVVFDGRGNEYSCIIERILDNSASMIKCKQLSNKSSEGVKLTVACAIPKKSKMDDIIDKLTQLGVDRIIPLETKRVIVNLDDRKKKSRLERWKKIAFNASIQSQRNTLPVIEPIKDINEVVSESGDFDLKLIPTLVTGAKTLKDALGKLKPKNILILIGPEGDFAPEEVKYARGQGFIPVSLGNLVLRVETAAIAVVGILNYALN